MPLTQFHLSCVLKKFRFCGDGDCPDWVLIGIHSKLVTLSSIKLRLLSQHVAKSILGESLPQEKIKDTFGVDDEKSMNLAKAAIACLKYLMINAVKYNTDTLTFNEELQQLGLPKEHAVAICKVTDDFSTQLRTYLASKSLSVDEVEEINVVKSGEKPFVQLEFHVKNSIKDGVPQKNTTEVINVHMNDVPLLIKELKTAHEIMNKYEKHEDKRDMNEGN